MILLHWFIGFALIIAITWKNTAARRYKHRCPIGFNIAYTKHREDDPICYRSKGPETFSDKFLNCAGNLYTTKLYHKLNITETNQILWTDYKSLYPGGPYIDWSYTENTGHVLSTSPSVAMDYVLLDEELCVVIDPVTNYTATKCDEMHYRYCFVKPYDDENDMSKDGCENLDGYYRFWTPRASCLRPVLGVGGGTVRANWKQAKELCVKRGGSLLGRGWRYANNPVFSASTGEPTFPLGITLASDNTSIRFDTANDQTVISPSEWNFENSSISPDTFYGALREDFWYLVNGSFMFYDVICERSIQLKTVAMDVTVDLEGKLILAINDTMNPKRILCFTDSSTFYPKEVKVRYDEETNIYVLKPILDGYYWCTHSDTRNVNVAESNKTLFIREKQSLVNYYAIEVDYKPNNYSRLDQFYEVNLAEYIFYWTKYVQVFGESSVSDPDTVETVLKEFKASHPGLEFREGNVLDKMRIKRYVDGKSLLFHVYLKPEMMPVPPGFWDDVEVLSMKPVYFCRAFDSVEMKPLGESTTTSDCRTHTCVGDFNLGVQWVTTATRDCTASVALNTTFWEPDEEAIDLPMPTAAPSTKIQNDPNWREYDDEDSSEETTNATRIPWRPTSPSTNSTTDMTTEIETESTTEAVTTEYVPSETVVTVTTPLEEVSTVTTIIPPLPLPPEDQLVQIMDDLETLLHNDSATITVDSIGQTFDQVDGLLEDQENVEIPGELLRLLDQIGARLDLNGSHQGSAIRSNIALLVADASAGEPVRGLRISAREDDVFREDAFEILSAELNSTHLNVNESEAVVHLPESVASSSRRISFVVFRNDRAFQTGNDYYAVNSRVLSINVEGVTTFDDGEVIDIHLSPMMEQPERNMSRACAYWHFDEENADLDTGYWSQDGCTLIRSTGEGILDTCRCDHLTHFAEILVPRAVFSERNENALEILTIIGCCLSIFGLCMVGVTALLFRSWRRDYSNKIWLHLCIAIFILVVCFLIVIFAKFEMYDVPCMLLGVALHYAVLASFCWMLVAAVLSYRRLVIVFSRDASHKLLRASAFSWGAPCAVVGILLSVDPHSYAGRFEEKSPSGAFCYPSGLGLWLAVYAPIAVMLIANWTLFLLIVRSVFASRRIQRHGDTNEALRCASVSCLLVFLFGLPWIFGLFAYNIVAAYLFTLTATYQGFVLFVFFVLGNKKTRDLWLNKLKIKQTRKVPVTSSTYTNRSTGVGHRGDPEGASSIENNSSKPRSLASPDNSRFS